MIRSAIFLCLCVLLICSCKDKKKPSLTGDEPVEVLDFIDYFPNLSLPVKISDTSLDKKSSDSAILSYAVFTQFVPDSVMRKDFGKIKPKIYPLGKTQEKGKETYLFVKAVSGSKRIGYILCFDKKNKYLNTLPIVKSGFDTYTSAYGSLDKKFQISIYRERKNKSGDVTYKRNIFIYNDASNEFTLILTEPNEEIMQNIVNPVDTFPQKNKFTGDYITDKRNFISFRDAKKPSEIIFFTHFEKNKGECKGDLKGIAKFISAKTAQYKDNGNPCTIQFNFTNTAVVMKEVEGCGSFRDIKCFFEGTFPKKKKKTTKKG
ncbi:MAG: hypothetical protein ABI415_07325 [Flavitalea sp.]